MARSATQRTAGRRPAATRLVLAGAVVYLLEWVAIIGAGIDFPVPPGTASSEVMSHYLGHADAAGFAAGWFALVLLGRMVLMIGIARSVAGAPRAVAALRLAVAAMALSVALEVVAYGLGAAAAEVAPSGAAGVVALNGAAWVLSNLVLAPAGVSVLCAVVGMWRSTMYPRLLQVPGVVAGLLLASAGLVMAPRLSGALTGLAQIGPLPMWIWMVWSGVVAWRGTRQAGQPSVVAAEHTPDAVGV